MKISDVTVSIKMQKNRLLAFSTHYTNLAGLYEPVDELETLHHYHITEMAAKLEAQAKRCRNTATVTLKGSELAAFLIFWGKQRLPMTLSWALTVQDVFNEYARQVANQSILQHSNF